jgi:transcriptional regulator with XRE-family HTH domain
MLKNNYKQIRQSANLSLSQIASFLGVGTRMVRYYESGGRVPSKSVAKLYGQLEEKTRKGAQGMDIFYMVEHNWKETSIYEKSTNRLICTFSLNEDEVTEENQEEMESDQSDMAHFVLNAMNKYYDELIATKEQD